MRLDTSNPALGADCVQTFFPFVYLLLLRHHALLTKGTTSEAVTEEAISAVNILLDVVESRVAELKAIWRRQRIDLEIQVRYYANGMFEDYYKVRATHPASFTRVQTSNLCFQKYLKDNLDRQELSLPVTDDWDDDDEWASEEEGGELADPDGAPLQGDNSTSREGPETPEPPARAAPQYDDQAERDAPRADGDDDEEYERQQNDNGRGADDEDDGGYGRSYDNDEGDEGEQPQADDEEENGDEEDNYSRGQSRRQGQYDYEEDE